jgi:hypothetical protein
MRVRIMDILGLRETSRLAVEKATVEGENDAQRLAIKTALKARLGFK